MAEGEDMELQAAEAEAAAEAAEAVPEEPGFDRAAATSAADFPEREGAGADDLRYRFYGAESLSDVSALSGRDLSATGSLSGTFHGCRSLADISPLASWDVSGVRGLHGTFYGCRSLSDISPLAGWDTSKVTGMGCLFEYCRSLVDATPLSGWDVSAVTDMMCLFAGCSSLEKLDLSTWDTSKVRNINNMFYGCEALSEVKLGPDFSFEGDGSSRCALPAPYYGVIPGTWQNSAGEPFEDPADIPSRTADSYTAVFDLPAVDFSDLSSTKDWYYEPIRQMVEHGYITGRGDGSFGVGESMTRGDYVTILWRIAKPRDYLAYRNDARNESGFSDVKVKQYYTKAINWAVKKRIASGYTRRKFGVGRSISFQDACLILARLANGNAKGLEAAMDEQRAAELVSGFEDGEEVSAYAVGGLAWCVQQGVVSGYPDKTLRPREALTRERAAVILWRAIDNKLI